MSSSAERDMLEVDLQHQLGSFALNAAFRAPQGITVLFGRSGSGKTTIVNAVAGLMRPNAGTIRIGTQVLYDSATGQYLPPHKRHVGYIFQEGRLFPHLSVRSNLTYGRWMSGTRADPALFNRIVEMLGLGALLTRRPGALSGGEKQRVAIGRALLAAPRLILADEPLAALDAERKAEILPYFERLRDEVKTPILYVSHSASEVARLATRVVALEDGRVLRQGRASDVLADPAVTPLGARAAGAILQAKVARHHPDGLTELSASGLPLLLPHLDKAPGSHVRIRIAATDVIIAAQAPAGLSALNVLPGTVDALRPGGGPGAIVSLQTPAGRLLARITQRSVDALGLHPGMSCHAVIKAVAVAPDDIGGTEAAPGLPRDDQH